MVRSTTRLRIQATARSAILAVTAITLISQLSPRTVQAFPHYGNWDSIGHGWIVFATSGVTVSGIAADSVSETGEAKGVACFQYLEFGRPGRHLSIEAKFRAAEYSFDDQGNVLGLILTGDAIVIDVPTQTALNATLQLVANGSDVDGFLTGEDWELEFEVSRGRELIAVETAGRMNAALATTGVRFGPGGELDTMATGVVGLSTGEVRGRTDVQVESGRDPFSAATVIDRMRVRAGREGVDFDLRGTSAVLTGEGACVSKSRSDFLMPLEDAFSASASFAAPRCGARAVMSNDGSAYLGWATFPDWYAGSPDDQ